MLFKLETILATQYLPRRDRETGNGLFELIRITNCCEVNQPSTLTFCTSCKHGLVFLTFDGRLWCSQYSIYMDEVKAIDRIARKFIRIRIDGDIVAEAMMQQREEEEYDNVLGTMSSVASLSPSSSMSDIIAPALSIAKNPGPKGKGPEP